MLLPVAGCQTVSANDDEARISHFTCMQSIVPLSVLDLKSILAGGTEQVEYWEQRAESERGVSERLESILQFHTMQVRMKLIAWAGEETMGSYCDAQVEIGVVRPQPAGK